MLILASLLPLSLLLSTPAHSLPTLVTAANNDDNLITESWLIPRLDMHFMSSHTDEPGTRHFPSSIDFDIVIPVQPAAADREHHSTGDGAVTLSTSDPASKTVTCSTTFASGTLPEEDTACAGEGLGEFEHVFFGMRPYSELGVRRAEISFVLDVWRVVVRGGLEDEEGNSTGTTTFLNGLRAISANDPHEPTSFLTCIEGAPYDGLSCHIKSYMSVHEDLVLEAEGLVMGNEEVVVPGPDGATGTYLRILEERKDRGKRQGESEVDGEEELGNPVAPC